MSLLLLLLILVTLPVFPHMTPSQDDGISYERAVYSQRTCIPAAQDPRYGLRSKYTEPSVG